MVTAHISGVAVVCTEPRWLGLQGDTWQLSPNNKAQQSIEYPSVLQLEGQVDAKKGKVIVDCKPDIDYEMEGPDYND